MTGSLNSVIVSQSGSVAVWQRCPAHLINNDNQKLFKACNLHIKSFSYFLYLLLCKDQYPF